MTKLNDLLLGKRIINVVFGFFLIVVLISVFFTMFRMEGTIYNKTDDAGEKVGVDILDESKVYHYITTIPMKGTDESLYFNWQMVTLYILIIAVIVLNFIPFKKQNSYKQLGISIGLIILLFWGVLLIHSLYGLQKEIAADLANMYFKGSYVKVEMGSMPIFLLIITIFVTLFSFYKTWILMQLPKLQLSNKKV